MTFGSIKTQFNDLTDWTTSWFYPKQEEAQTDSDLDPSIATLTPALSISISYPSSKSNPLPLDTLSQNVETEPVSLSEKDAQTDQTDPSQTLSPSSFLFSSIFYPFSNSTKLPSDTLSQNIETEPVSLSEKDAQTDQTYLSQILSPFSFLFSWIFYPFSSSTKPASDTCFKNVEIELVSLSKKDAQNVENKSVSLTKKDAQTAHTYTFQILSSLSSLFSWIFFPCFHFAKSRSNPNPSSSDRISTQSEKRSFLAYSRPSRGQTTLSLRNSSNLKKKSFEHL